jgi:hypothetical protein
MAILSFIFGGIVGFLSALVVLIMGGGWMLSVVLYLTLTLVLGIAGSFRAARRFPPCDPLLHAQADRAMTPAE